MKVAAATGASSLLANSTVTAADDSERSESADKTLAESPPMGWNSWNTFYCDIDEELIKDAADAMVESGMMEAGYEYVCIDDCWMAPERDANGKLQPDPETFPNGISALTDYVHDKGLKFGIYESAGTTTCQGLPGSLGYEETDAQTFADWGVDLLKYDNCGDHYGLSAVERYTRMHNALEAVDRDIVLSICEWGDNDPWMWAPEVGGDLWRTTGDIKPLWSAQEDLWGNGIIDIIDQNEPLAEYAGPGRWNDPDMLVVGVDLPEYPNLTEAEDRTHFGMWAMMAAPLMAGNDIRNMSDGTRDILTNDEVIAIDQDPAGNQATRIQHIRGEDGLPRSVWAKTLANGDRAVGLLNRSDRRTTVTTSAQAVGLEAASCYVARDLWNGTDWQTAGLISASVPSHGLALYRVSSGSPDGTNPFATVSLGETEATVAPGESITRSLTFTNYSPMTIDSVHVTCDAPDGWESEPTSTTFTDITAGPAISGASGPQNDAETDWMVRPPRDAPPEDYELGVTAEYANGVSIAESFTVTVENNAGDDSDAD
ncbi:alpha-galactosidase (plasmid) [Haloterrigena salifodinae]|uniref:alpha-galactosidase n=1 Tax=Haloterrigena salifodinae TaxID=2675099 RepID=A0A8T8E6I6_9EURY|nr:alpha-galactosidase [Haloterrigena salifodinae]QRV17475.1 alpha-galactosidase [Haloterrigena salifodinae]